MSFEPSGSVNGYCVGSRRIFYTALVFKISQDQAKQEATNGQHAICSDFIRINDPYEDIAMVEDPDGFVAKVLAGLEDWVDEHRLVSPYWRLELDGAGLLKQWDKNEF